MTRLFLASALVLQLSGVAAVAAFVCAPPAMTVGTCCCHHESESAPGTPTAAPVCPCAMAPMAPPPVTQTPVTVTASSDLLSTPALFAPAPYDAAVAARAETLGHRAFAGTGPPLSASHLRC